MANEFSPELLAKVASCVAQGFANELTPLLGKYTRVSQGYVNSCRSTVGHFADYYGISDFYIFPEYETGFRVNYP